MRRIRFNQIAAVLVSVLMLAGIGATAGADPGGQRIVGGTQAAAAEFPHHVSVRDSSGHLCGGSILNSLSVVTTARCVVGVDPSTMYVRSGVTNDDDLQGQDMDVETVIINPTFAASNAGDVAVLHLERPLVLSSTVAPIALGTSDEAAAELSATILGWGETAPGGPISDNLLSASVSIYSDAECSAVLPAGATLSHADEICTTSSPAAFCDGDTGGSLISQGGTLIGIMSRVVSCGTAPGISTEVPTWANWITTNLADGTTVAPTPAPTPTPDPNAPMCAGQAVTVSIAAGDLPTAGDDVILGTEGDDVIAAGDGNDVICGLGGDDQIWGQAGWDDIYGDAGDDKIRGGDGNDELFGGEGADNMNGGRGDDRVMAEGGDDPVVRGGTGNDIVDGGAGNDPLVAGNGGIDDVFGGEGNDKVTGGPRPDEIFGGPGDDELRGLGGADRLSGDEGDDTLFGGKQADQLFGGEGTDICNGGTTGGDAPEADSATDCEDEVPINIP